MDVDGTLMKPSRETGESTVPSKVTSHRTPLPAEELGQGDTDGDGDEDADVSRNGDRDRDRDRGEHDHDHSSGDEGGSDFDSDYDSAEERDAFSVGDGDDGSAYSYASSASGMVTDSQSVGSDMGSSSALTNVEENDKETQSLAQREVRAGRCGRCAGLLFLALTLGVLLPVTLHTITINQEEVSFRLTFLALSDDLGNAWRENLARAFVALDSVAVSSLLAAPPPPQSNHSWPEVTVPGFSTISTQAQFSSSNTILSNALAPIVNDSDRSQYEFYVLSQGGNANPQVYEIVNGDPIVAPAPGPYYPVRHIQPDRPQAINYNLASNTDLETDLHESTGTISAVVGRLLDENADRALLTTFLLADQVQANVTLLYSTLVYPVKDTMDNNVVGSVVAILSWSDTLANILPAQAQGIVCVIQNSCGQVASLQIDGSVVKFLGFKDAHDTAFSSFGSSYNLLNLGLEARTIGNIPLSENHADTCQYQLYVYPSVQTEDSYHTVDPMLFVGVSIGFFVLTLLLFVVYDRFWERRNRAILASAIEARAIVSSLFPANVRDRLFETNRVKRKKKKKLKMLKKKMKKLRRKKKKKDDADGTKESGNKDDASMDIELASGSCPSSTMQNMLDTSNLGNSVRNLEQALGNGLIDLSQVMTRGQGFVSHPKHQLKNLLAHNNNLSQLDHNEEMGLHKPIADLFPHTTVMFADIVGFTAWSSERAPEDVFTLLQTIYHAFDSIARRRGVFKVETIGDCYVAVTGLPEPQEDHAVRMTKFARECMAKMTDVTKKLEVALGPDTGDLVLRLGLNSGPVTAGVLQGDKSRFQLFGDTVNTASRMESTGERNKVHISQSTAKLLTEAGKGYWVRPREDLVHAKGKGNVQTYWLVSRSDNFQIQANKSSDDYLDNDVGIKRTSPCRTRSMLPRSEPTRQVKRTTSDSARKLDLKSESATQMRDDQREERLVQWQLELFTRLLKKIVAARDEVPPPCPPFEKQQKSDGWRVVAKSHNPTVGSFDRSSSIARSTDNSLNLTDHSISLNSRASSVVDRFSQRQMVVGPPLRLPRRDSAPKIPGLTRQASLDSFDVSISTFHTSGGDLTKDLDTFHTSGGDLTTDLETFHISGGDLTMTNGLEDIMIENDKIVVDEVVETITLPKFNAKSIKALEKADSVELSEEVISQMKDYIFTMAQMYRQNPFHNFEHASHVTMSANKLLNRIVIPENVDYDRESGDIAEDLHDYTYGITSDPLTQFAVVFSALVHDCDHAGVPNGQLGKENPDMAAYYRDQSLAEQNSVDLAWDLFMDPRYGKLQDCIAATDDERKRFRQLVVNSVLATDIFDPKMKSLRNQRWDKAFHRNPNDATEITEAVMEADRNMKATIVIEHIIQASDVAHTMQHWHVYQKWNERLFSEMYSAYECGRSKTNPAEGWYKGELWFFDNYVIPLAKKLEECHVFGVASDECLNYAQANRNEWFIKGEEIVAQMVERYHAKKFFVAGIAKKKHPNKRPVRRLPREEALNQS